MKYFINRFSVLKKSLVFAVLILAFFTIATINISCYSEKTLPAEKQIEQTNISNLETKQSNYIEHPVIIIAQNLRLYKKESLLIHKETATEDKKEPTLTPTPVPTVIPENIRENKLYYAVDKNNYRYDLDIEYQDYLYEMCIKYEVTEYYTLFLAQMYHESRFKIDVISKTNDYGLMQINTCNHKWLGEILGNDNFLDPYNNIEAGIYMMSHYLKKYDDVEKALVCYNRGESVVKKGTYSTSYSKGVLKDMNLLIELELD